MSHQPKYNSPNSGQEGFTLIEMLLSLALMALLAGMSMPVFSSLWIASEMDTAVNTVAQNLERAQLLSQAVQNDSRWGVYIAAGIITLYKGDTYAGRDDSYDETFPISGSIEIQGASEFNFAKLSGEPLSGGTVTLTYGDRNRSITVNQKGTVEF